METRRGKRKTIGAPHSYAVTTATGRELRRHRAHIREAHQENRAVEPDWNEQSLTKDFPTMQELSTENPLRNDTSISPDTCTTSSGSLIKPLERLDL